MPETKEMGKIALDHAFYYGAGHEMELLGLAEEAGPMTVREMLAKRKGRARPAVYLVKLPLPDKEALAKLALAKLYTRPLGDWYEDAKSDEEGLRDEMTEWRDNMDGSGLENTSKFEEVSQAADSMEAQELPGMPEALAGIPVTVHPSSLVVSARHRHGKDRTGRSWRHSEALGILEAVKEAAEALGAELRGKATEEAEERAAIAEEFAGEIANYTDEVEGVDFPGMF